MFIEISDNPNHSNVKRKVEVLDVFIGYKDRGIIVDTLVHHYQKTSQGGFGESLANKPTFKAYKVQMIGKNRMVNAQTGVEVQPTYIFKDKDLNTVHEDSELVVLDNTEVVYPEGTITEFQRLSLITPAMIGGDENTPILTDIDTLIKSFVAIRDKNGGFN